MSVENTEREGRKEYYPPKVVHTEKIETRAVTCAKSSDPTCGAGPIQS